MDYNDLAAHLENLFLQLKQHKQRERENAVLVALFLLTVGATLLILLRVRFLPMIIVMGGLLLIALIWIVRRIMQTSADAAELEQEVELLRYRLVADDVSLTGQEKPKRDTGSKRKRSGRLDPDMLADLGRMHLGGDGEIITRRGSSKKANGQHLDP